MLVAKSNKQYLFELGYEVISDDKKKFYKELGLSISELSELV